MAGARLPLLVHDRAVQFEGFQTVILGAERRFWTMCSTRELLLWSVLGNRLKHGMGDKPHHRDYWDTILSETHIAFYGTPSQAPQPVSWAGRSFDTTPTETPSGGLLISDQVALHPNAIHESPLSRTDGLRNDKTPKATSCNEPAVSTTTEEQHEQHDLRDITSCGIRPLGCSHAVGVPLAHRVYRYHSVVV